MNLGFWEIVVILFVVLIVFGPSKVPELSRAIGRSLREFRKAMSEIEESLEAEVPPPKETAAQAPSDANLAAAHPNVVPAPPEDKAPSAPPQRAS